MITMTDAKIYNAQGKEVGTYKLPENIFALPWNGDLVHQVVVAMEGNTRTPVAHTKGRGEVRGGGKKPWRQKGTGRARHGSIRSPIWRGGGVTHGPLKEKNYERKINKKMKWKALYTVLSRKAKDGEIIFLDNVSFDTPKTKQVKEMVTALSGIKGFEGVGKKRNAAYFAVPKRDENIAKSFRNMGNIKVDEIRNLNPVQALRNKFLVISSPKESIAFLEGRMKKTRVHA
jgi:large subunit ribosomal protein L4